MLMEPNAVLPALQNFWPAVPTFRQALSSTICPGLVTPACSEARAVIGLNVEPVG